MVTNLFKITKIFLKLFMRVFEYGIQNICKNVTVFIITSNNMIFLFKHFI